VPAPQPEAEAGDTATWTVDVDDPPTAGSSSFTALVTRVGCGGGRTGEVLRPEVGVTETEVVLTFTVAALEGPAPCPGNDAVPTVVDLGTPLGDRLLVDGGCRTEPDAAPLCADDGVRWRPGG